MTEAIDNAADGTSPVGPVREGRAIALALIIAVAVCACSPAPVSEDGSGAPASGDTDWALIAHDCLELLDTYQETDLESEREAELARQMEEALLNQDVCARALSEAYDGQGDQVMADHLGRAIGIHALQAELALSSRFDGMAGYCAILTDLIHALDEDLTEIDESLPELGETDLRAVLPLRQLTGQTLQLSLLDYTETCQ